MFMCFFFYVHGVPRVLILLTPSFPPTRALDRGTPAGFSKANGRVEPRGWLEVSTDPVAEGDYAMLAGYPCRTYRHRMAMEFAHQVETGLPSRIALYDAMLEVIEGASAGNKAAEVAYASYVGRLKDGDRKRVV